METIMPLTIAAQFLDFQALQDVCLIFLATRFYIEPTETGFEDAKKRLNITKTFTQEDRDQIYLEYPSLK